MPLPHVSARRTAVALVLVACSPEQAPPPGGLDAEPRIRRDGGPVDVYIPPIPDTGPRPDVPPPDAASDAPDARSDGGRDAGSTTDAIVVDGRLTDRAWADAEERTTDGPSGDPFAAVHVTRLLYLRSPAELAIAIEGTFPISTNVVAVYLDLGYPSFDSGIALNGVALDDHSGAVDDVLSNAILSTDPGFRPELGWGSGHRPESPTASSATLGWRALSSMGPHTPVVTQRNACSATACESVVSLAALGVDPAATLALALRVGDPGLPDEWAPGQAIPPAPLPAEIPLVEPIAAAGP